MGFEPTTLRYLVGLFCFIFIFWVERGRTGAVCITSRAVRGFPALSLRRVRPSYGTFFLMAFLQFSSLVNDVVVNLPRNSCLIPEVLVFYLKFKQTDYLNNSVLSLDDCRSIQFLQPLENMALNNHVIRKDLVMNEDLCQLNCYLEPNCVSYNYGPYASGDGAFVCELSDRSHQGVSSSDLRTRDGFTYNTITVSRSP